MIVNEFTNDIDFYVPIINYPDHQGRLWKNKNDIQWRGKVHERLIGYSTVTNLPEEVAIVHRKEIATQEFQNEFYETI